MIIRPLQPGEATAAQDLAGETFDDLDRSLGETVETGYDDPGRRATGTARALAALASDPDGCWAAVDDDGTLAGVAIALRRGGLWILSLLTIRVRLQGQGIGRRLLDAARTTEAAATGGLIFASRDPRALRRYHSAGFALEPGYVARGGVDRAALPAGLGVCDGDLDRDADLLDAVSRHVRGVSHAPDLPLMRARGLQILVLDTPGARGFAAADSRGVWLCAATEPAAAQRLLWAGLAATSHPTVTVPWLTGRQQWAIDTVLAARLSLASGGSVCHKGDVGPFAPYLPTGIWG